VYLVFASGKEQPWNKRAELTTSNDEKPTKIPDELNESNKY